MKKEMTLPGPALGLGGRVKAQIIEHGRVVKETPWAHNLILDQGMDRITTVYIVDLFKYCVVGTANTPTEDDSGAITATTSGATCTASAPFFAAGDVGKLLRFDTGQKAKITAFTSSTVVTLAATLSVTTQLFTMYRVTQTGLATETKRTVTYLAGAGNCGTTRVGAVVTHRRTYDFTAEVGNQNYAEVGFSDVATVAANLNMRALFAGGAVTVLIGQQLRVIYDFNVTVSPITPRTIEPTITGWPSLTYAVTFDSTTDKVTLASHGFAADTKIKFQGSIAPGGITFGTQYYVVVDATNTFKVAASAGGAAIDITSNGTSVLMTTNLRGTEQMTLVGLSSVNVSTGNRESYETNGGGAVYCNEPAGVANAVVGMNVCTTTTAQPTYPGSLTLTAVTGGGKSSLTNDAYVAGSFTRTARAVYAPGEANSALIRSFGITVGQFGLAAGLYYLLDQKQEKLSTFTLTVIWRWTWDRGF